MAYVLPPMPQRISLITRLAQQKGLDPRAVLAVARQEGLSGGIGDLAGGGSYGPFQLYAQGALPAQYRGNPSAAQSFAWSPQGINYALGRMLSVGAGGQTGANAIRTIVSKFERPADPRGEIQRAIRAYGAYTPGANAAYSQGALPSAGNPRAALPALGSAAVAPSRSVGDPGRNILVQGLASGQDIYDLIPQMVAARAPSGVGTMGTRIAPRTAPTPLGTSGQPNRFRPPVELFYDPLGGIKNGQRIGAIGGHSDHLHYASGNAQQMIRAITLAQKLGLSARENPYVEKVDPVHTQNSYHYRTFPGVYGGRRVGQGVDISGSDASLRRLYQLLAGRR